MGESISIFGAGYIGSVSAGCLAKLGHRVILADIDEMKVNSINSGKAHIYEPGLDELIREGVAQKRIEATLSTEHAIMNTNISFICVGTPSTEKGGLNLEHVLEVVGQIAPVLGKKKTFHVIAIRSTVLPGTIDKCISIIEGKTNKKHGTDFGICSNPEFLREGTAIDDYFNPPYTLIGSDHEKSRAILKNVYKDINSPVYETETKVAELIKYINNSFHALKVVFGNEIGNICKNLSIDSHKVMELFLKDKKLNISPYYLLPGFAFGGSCLPKDLKALCYYAKSNDIDIPMLSSIMNSNIQHIQNAINLVYATQKKKIGICGLSFKDDTDDLRESPMITLIETLLGKGYELKIYDKNVQLSRIHGSNKNYLEKHIPHITKLLLDHDKLDELIDLAEVIIIGSKDMVVKKQVLKLINKTDKIIIDLVRLEPDLVTSGNYIGICW